MMDLTAYFKRGSIGDHNVSVLADFKRTNPVSNSDMLGCADRNCAESIVFAYSGLDCKTC